MPDRGLFLGELVLDILLKPFLTAKDRRSLVIAQQILLVRERVKLCLDLFACLAMEWDFVRFEDRAIRCGQSPRSLVQLSHSSIQNGIVAIDLRRGFLIAQVYIPHQCGSSWRRVRRVGTIATQTSELISTAQTATKSLQKSNQHGTAHQHFLAEIGRSLPTLLF